LGLSSPSVAHYHVNKLLKAGLLKEEKDGYTVDKIVYESMIRIRRTVLPLQTAYAFFFITALVILVTVMRPARISSTYVFALITVIAAVAVSIFEAYKASKSP
jgi:DNA-binding transcriptional ArsR family regulator